MTNVSKILITLVALCIIGMGVFVLAWPEARIPTDLPTKELSENTLATAPVPHDWKTYRHAEVGFQFQYPPNYLLMTGTANDPEAPGTFHFNRPDPVVDALNEDVYSKIIPQHIDLFLYPETLDVKTMNIYTLPLDEQKYYLEEWQDLKNGIAPPTGAGKYEKFHFNTLDSRIVGVAGVNGLRLLTEEWEDGRDDKGYSLTFTLFSPKGDWLEFSFILTAETSEGALADDHNQVFDQIIKTLKFAQ